MAQPPQHNWDNPRNMYSLPNIWAEQSVCTSINKNAATHSNMLRLKNVSKEGGLRFIILMRPYILAIFDTSNIEMAKKIECNLKAIM